MMCAHPFVLTLKNGRRIICPCGKCMPCRIARTRDWSIRLMMEEKTSTDTCFITLTYDDEHLPENGSLVKSDLQKFWKRLRKDCNSKIRYYACGEYGDEKQRPHYHAIIFGLGVNETTRQLLKDNWRLCDSSRFNGTKSGLSFCEPDSIRYVTGYIQKKLNGDMAKIVYGDRLAPFQCSSQKLGNDYFITHKDELVKQGCLIYRGKTVNFPKYFVVKYELDTSESIIKARDVVIKSLHEHGIDDDEIKLADRKNVLNSLFLGVMDSELSQKEINEKAKLALRKKKL